jgi:four helix bundle protein
MYEYAFEKLNVWQNSRGLTLKIYEVTKSFPADEKYGLVSQMRRAMISVSSNIAEGSSRKTAKDQAHFYTTAYSSLIELLNQIILSLDLKYIDTEKYLELRSSIELISNQLNSLRKFLVKK